MKKKFVAFTLAEVLITLGIIGVVAAMTLPTLNQAINNKVRAEQVRTVKYKFTKATEKMNSLGLIGPYASTDAFVDELQKHLKIMKRCDASHLRECWPYDEINTTNGAIAVSSLTNGSSLMMRTTDDKDFSSPSVGIVTADGVSMILNYNKKCSALDPVVQYGWSTSDGKPETNATAGCVAAIFEINGAAKPNKYKEDVFAFNSNGLNGECAVTLGTNGKCWGAIFIPTPIKKVECDTLKNNKYGIRNCSYNDDSWAGAVKQCGGIANMPNANDIMEIGSLLYDSDKGEKEATLISLGLSAPPFKIWTSDEYNGGSAYYGNFWETGYNILPSRYSRYASSIYAMCLAD